MKLLTRRLSLKSRLSKKKKKNTWKLKENKTNFQLQKNERCFAMCPLNNKHILVFKSQFLKKI